MVWANIFKPKKVTEKPIINKAVDDKNAALNDIYAYQNQNQSVPVKKVKK